LLAIRTRGDHHHQENHDKISYSGHRTTLQIKEKMEKITMNLR
jgi:hypothetical protein